MSIRIPRVMFAATGSGSGKTTITCAVLQALQDKGIRPAAFKCGPDYIDPMFHTEVIGTKSRNLDLFLLSEDVCRYLLAVNSADAGIAVMEGVMGYYDGLGGNSTTSSSWHLASVTKTPVILIVNCAGASLSLAALIRGFVGFREDSRIKGVILNNLSPSLYPQYKEMLEKETGIEILGYLPRMQECALKSRHLGLITASEVRDLQHKIRLLARQATLSIDLDRLMAIADQAEETDIPDIKIEAGPKLNLAVAKDKAFCFYYQDSLELLEKMGATISYFSPLKDRQLPDCDGLILGGGYPEIYARELSENTMMQSAIRSALDNKMPCLAECGGFMYLLDSITDREGYEHKMTGFLPGKASLKEKLNRFGYVNLTALEDNVLCSKGDTINAHEFHYSDSTLNGEGMVALKPTSGKGWNCINTSENLFAGYPHIHLWGNIRFAGSFLEKCRQYREGRAVSRC